MNWIEVNQSTSGVQWQAYPNDLHAIDVCPHQTEGWVWFVITDDVDDNAPEGWSATLDDAKRHAEQAYLEWLDVTEGRKPIPDEWLDAHDETAEVVAAAVAQERAAVVAWLRGEPERLVACDGHRHADGKPCFVLSPMTGDELADAIERGEHRREEER